jgi:hypothetical protein
MKIFWWVKNQSIDKHHTRKCLSDGQRDDQLGKYELQRRTFGKAHRMDRKPTT